MSSNNAIETPTHKGPGAMLQQAREKAGVSLEHISAETLIPLSRLSALETEDFERVGGAAYVIGYARNAAETIGVDPKPIVEAYTELLNSASKGGAQALNPAQVVAAPALPKKAKLILMGVGGAFIVLVIILAFLLLGDEQPSSEAPSKKLMETSLAATEIGSGEPNSTDVESVDGKPVSVEPQAEIEVKSLAEKIEEPSVENVMEVPEVTAMTSVGETGKASQHLDTQQLNSKKTEPQESVSQNPGSQELEQVNVLSSLSLFFTEECWIQITDASGKRLLARVASSGDHLSVEGLTPFDVMLGNATAVLIELNGESVDVVPRRGKRTLRLSVGS